MTTYSLASGFVKYYGGNGNDFLAGTNSDNALYGEEGNDVLIGASAFGGEGERDCWVRAAVDVRSPRESGNDYLDGGSGNIDSMALTATTYFTAAMVTTPVLF